MQDASAQSLLAQAGRQARRANAGAALAAAAQALCSVAFAWLLAGLVDRIAFGGAGLDDAAPWLGAMLGVACVRAAAAFAAERLGFEAAARARAWLFDRLLAHAAALGPARLANEPVGETAATLIDATDALDPYYRRWVPTMAGLATSVATILPLALTLDWRSGLVFAVTAPLFVVAAVFIGRGAEAASQAQMANLARLSGSLLDSVRGLRDLKLFGAARRRVAEIDAMSDAYRRSTMQVLRVAFLNALALEFFATVSIAFVAILAGFRLLEGTLDFHAGFFMLLLAPLFYAPLRAMGAERHAKMEAIAAAGRLVAFLDRAAPPAEGAPLTLAGPPAIRFEGVRLAHADRVALEDFNLDVKPGERVALVGPSGAGKTSALALLLGFATPTRGRITIAGHDLSTLDPASLRAAITYAPQRAWLFAGAIADNVALGREGDLAAALEAAGAAGFVAALPEGAQSAIGEDGALLSGGQAQRISLARTLFSSAPILLLDEPTAHLDSVAQAQVSAAIATASLGRTAIIVAHRLTTVLGVDRIIVMDRGRVVDQGSHAEMLARGGIYARMIAAGDLA